MGLPTPCSQTSARAAESLPRTNELLHVSPYRRKAFTRAMNAGWAVQKVLCTCIGAGLAVRRVPCTSSQHAWTCRESFARSRSREFQCIDILVPQIWHHAPHPSNDQNMPNNDVFSTTIITFSGWGSASGILAAAGCAWGQSSVPANLAMQCFCTDCVGK